MAVLQHGNPFLLRVRLFRQLCLSQANFPATGANDLAKAQCCLEAKSMAASCIAQVSDYVETGIKRSMIGR